MWQNNILISFNTLVELKMHNGLILGLDYYDLVMFSSFFFLFCYFPLFFLQQLCCFSANHKCMIVRWCYFIFFQGLPPRLLINIVVPFHNICIFSLQSCISGLKAFKVRQVLGYSRHTTVHAVSAGPWMSAEDNI